MRSIPITGNKLGNDTVDAVNETSGFDFDFQEVKNATQNTPIKTNESVLPVKEEEDNKPTTRFPVRVTNRLDSVFTKLQNLMNETFLDFENMINESSNEVKEQVALLKQQVISFQLNTSLQLAIEINSTKSLMMQQQTVMNERLKTAEKAMSDRIDKLIKDVDLMNQSGDITMKHFRNTQIYSMQIEVFQPFKCSLSNRGNQFFSKNHRVIVSAKLEILPAFRIHLLIRIHLPSINNNF